MRNGNIGGEFLVRLLIIAALAAILAWVIISRITTLAP